MTDFPEKCGERCRGLTAGERTMVFGVFNTALNLNAIRIHDHPDPTGDQAKTNPHTLGNDIFVPASQDVHRNRYFDDYTTAPIYVQGQIIHEMAHVWQNQTGRGGAMSHNTAMKVIEAIERSRGDTLKISEMQRAHVPETGRRQTHDIIGGNWMTDPVVKPGLEYSTTMTWTDVEGGRWQGKQEIAQPEIRLSDQYAAKHGLDPGQVREHFQRTSDYDYLSGPLNLMQTDKIFGGLNAESQATMIQDYFLLSKGVNPAVPFDNGDPSGVSVPNTGKRRPSIYTLMMIIPFLRSPHAQR